MDLYGDKMVLKYTHNIRIRLLFCHMENISDEIEYYLMLYTFLLGGIIYLQKWENVFLHRFAFFLTRIVYVYFPRNIKVVPTLVF